MKAFISIVAIGVYSFSMVSGAIMHTARDIREIYEPQFIPAKLVEKSPRELAELKI